MSIQLDEHQLKAVKHLDGPALVVAGPGSGKTAVITERIVNLIREYGINANKILALAFNKEAAKEMEQRVLPEIRKTNSPYGTPKIQTLHAFGLEIINRFYTRLDLETEPTRWTGDPEKTIRQEIMQLKRETADVPVTVYIYRIGNRLTDKCYIGQTTNWKRRKEEHLNDSSNPELRQAILNEGVEQFTFEIKETVSGRIADSCETKWIEYYKSQAVFNLENENVYFQTEFDDNQVTVYKIESQKSRVCYFGYSNSPELIHEKMTLVPNDALQQAIIDEGIDQFKFDILYEDIPVIKASELVSREINIRKNMVVYNRSNPLSQRYSNRLMVELFCEHFNLTYEEVLKHPADIKNLSDKFENYEKIVRDVKKAKREVVEDFSNYNSIEDIINFILGSINDIVVKTFAERYEKKKKEANAIDFQDMILYAVYLFERYPDIHAKYCEKYDYVLVDEFQDLSPIDYRLIKTLSNNLFTVGDDDQAIYSFRGGDSAIMHNFYKQKDVKKYKITKNYRSTMTIVNHSKALIDHNSKALIDHNSKALIDHNSKALIDHNSKALIDHNQSRIPKNLHANSTTRLPIRVFETTNETETPKTDLALFPLTESNQIVINQSSQQVTIVENMLMRELTNSVSEKTAILVRYRSEVDRVREILKRKGFAEEVRDEQSHKKGGPFNFTGEGNEQIRVSTIHSVKGKEYDKVILIHNALGEEFPFHDCDNLPEERRVFYTAMTRAKHDLVIIGGECPFVWELRKAHIPELERLSDSLKSAINHRIDNIRRQLENVSDVLPSKINKRFYIAQEQVDKVDVALPQALESQLARQKDAVKRIIRKQHAPELESLRCDIIETDNITKEIKTALPQQVKIAQKTFLLKLIPILDNLESIAVTSEKLKLNDDLPELATFCEDIQSAQKQFLNFLNNHGIVPIETIGQSLNLSLHEELQPGIFTDEVSKEGCGKVTVPRKIAEIFTDEVSKDGIVRELRRGYVLNDQVIRKAQVIVSKGQWHAYRIFMDFEKPVCIVTDQENYFVDKVLTLPEFIKGVDIRGLTVRLHKHDVLFAFPKTEKEAITLQRQPIENIPDSKSISEDFLNSVIVRGELTDVKKQRFYLNVITWSGYVLKGYLRAFDEDALCMWIDEQFVVVYRHALLKIERIEYLPM